MDDLTPFELRQQRDRLVKRRDMLLRRIMRDLELEELSQRELDILLGVQLTDLQELHEVAYEAGIMQLRFQHAKRNADANKTTH